MDLRRDVLIPVVSPLRWAAGDDRLSTIINVQPNGDSLLAFLSKGDSLEQMRLRYREVSAFDCELFAIPSHDRILNGIVAPLQGAKAAYILGHFLSTIAQGGVVAEMLAIFRYEISDITADPSVLDAVLEKRDKNKSFDRLSQKSRCQALKAIDLIDEPVFQLFNSVRNVRNRYLHLLHNDYSKLQIDVTFPPEHSPG